MNAAERHFREHRYDFELSTPDHDQVEYVYLTTADAKAVADALANLGSVIDVIAVHPEFLGWTVEEIAGKLE